MLLKLTKNKDGKPLRINPNHVIDIQEGDKKDDQEAKTAAGPKSSDKNKDKGKDQGKEQGPGTVRIVECIENRRYWVTETMEDIDAQLGRSGGKNNQKMKHLEIQTRLLAELLQKQGVSMDQIKEVMDLSKPYFQKK